MQSYLNHPYKTIVCADCGEFIRVPCYCGDRMCSICSKSRSFKIRSRLEAFFKIIRLKKGEKYAHVVLTVKNQENLRQMLKSLVRCFRTLRNRRSWRYHVSGGAFVLEVAGREGDWHAHLHIICQSRYFPQRLLLANWRAVAGNAGAFIKATPLHALSFYLTKYITKPFSATIPSGEVSAALSGLRLFQPFGSWHSLIKQFMPPRFPCPNCGCEVWHSLDAVWYSHPGHFLPGLQATPLLARSPGAG